MTWETWPRRSRDGTECAGARAPARPQSARLRNRRTPLAVIPGQPHGQSSTYPPWARVGFGYSQTVRHCESPLLRACRVELLWLQWTGLPRPGGPDRAVLEANESPHLPPNVRCPPAPRLPNRAWET